jgi:hypothetical protein
MEEQWKNGSSNYLHGVPPEEVAPSGETVSRLN